MSTSNDKAHAEKGERIQQPRSSRKLSGERLARKRELDRQAQHQAREKTKNYISHLESLVDSLKTPSFSSPLIQQIDEKRNLNGQLLNALKSIGRTAEGTLKLLDLGPSTTKRNEGSLHPPSEGDASPDQAGAMISALSILSKDYATVHPQLQAGTPAESLSNRFGNRGISVPREKWTRASSPMRRTIPGILHECDGPWRFTRSLMMQTKAIQYYPIVSESTDVQIPVQAILLGWDTVEKKYMINPLWQILRQTDEGIFFGCSPIIRLAAMCLMHLTMKFQVDPSDENIEALPLFMRPRPCQQVTEHLPVVDYFPWPGLREYFIFFEHEFCSSNFSRAFMENYHFSWPFDFQDSYGINIDTGLFELSKIFKERLFDLRSWSMNAPFFDAFPQLRGEILLSDADPQLHVMYSSTARQPTQAPIYTGEATFASRKYLSFHRSEDFNNDSNNFSNTSTADQDLPGESSGLCWGEVLQECAQALQMTG